MAQSFVVDNSVVMSWCFRDEGAPYAWDVFGSLKGDNAFVPSVWPLEAGNTVLVAERRGRISPDEVVPLLDMFDELPFQVEHAPSSRLFREIVNLARDHQLSTYDASYLDLALRRRLPLATQDKALMRAAGACGVEIFTP